MQTNSSKISFITQGELNAILITSFVFILIFFIVFLLFFIYKKKSFFIKTHKHNLPNIFYSKTNILDSNTDFGATILTNPQNHNQPCVQIGNIEKTSLDPRLVQNHSKEELFKDYLNFSNNKINNMMNNEELKSLTQPLLGQNEGVFPSAMIAPNIEVLPDNLFKSNPINQLFNFPELVNRNDMKDIEDMKISLEQQLFMSNMSSKSDSNSTSLPRLLKTSDLYLIEKISQGQFSSVWKGRCTNSKTAEPSDEIPEYGVKVFGGQQKSAWSNEKDIYNTLSTTNPNILKYFCSDVHELPKTQQSTNSFFPFYSNEYWIMTEYHPNGSLYDYLKANYLTWFQMVKIAHSILEGLAYLHSENFDLRKPFAIAHRDLKSKNVLVKNDGQSCCIADFGLALKLNNHNKLNSAEIRSKVIFFV